MSARTLSTAAAATGLGSLAVLHLVWAAGSSWPMGSRAELADAVVGRESGPFPSTAECLAVAGALKVAALCVAWPEGRPRAVRLGVARATVLALLGRGTLGMLGRTDLISPGSSSPRFRSLDRRLYSPICLTLAVLAAPSALRARCGR